MVATIVLAVTLAPCLFAVLRENLIDRIVAVQMGGTIATLAFVTFAIAVGRADYLDVAIVLAVLSFAGGIAYARLAERWL
jgi:multicomponent Na+:H+ antiporter subunit F